MKKILITGAAGFIGYHLSKRLLHEGYTIFGIDNINYYYDPSLKFARLAQLKPDAEALEVSEPTEAHQQAGTLDLPTFNWSQ
jgi:UDP-glucuronate 4-epimerase